MASINIKEQAPAAFTHEGARARHASPEQQLRRSLFSCMLWEKEFYEDGQEIGARIMALVPTVKPERVMEIAIEAREQMNLRHAPLLVAYAMTKHATHRHLVAKTLERIIQRPDELTEYLAIYVKDGGRRALSGQSKKGLARAFSKFDEYSLAKYDREGKQFSLKDVLFLCHAKPKDAAQTELFKRVIAGTLAVPDTWEVELSKGGADKHASWTRLLKIGRLKALALLRNLRNMAEAKVDLTVLRDALRTADTRRVLPFRFIAAARFAPHLEPDLEQMLFRCTEAMPRLKGRTLVMVDVSGSMKEPISAKSDMRRIDGACGLAIVLREISGEIRVVRFARGTTEVPTRRGFALRDAIGAADGGTWLGAAVAEANAGKFGEWDRLVVFTDEQSEDAVPAPKGRGYMINVASAKHGVGYGPWVHLDGFSEAVVGYIAALEDAGE